MGTNTKNSQSDNERWIDIVLGFTWVYGLYSPGHSPVACGVLWLVEELCGFLASVCCFRSGLSAIVFALAGTNINVQSSLVIPSTFNWSGN